jgi:hypothetical protein
VLDGDCRLATCCFLVIVVGRLGIRQRRHLTTSHGDGGARIEGGLLRKFVRALIKRSLVEVAVSAQPCGCTTLHAPHDRVELLRVGGAAEWKTTPASGSRMKTPSRRAMWK